MLKSISSNFSKVFGGSGKAATMVETKTANSTSTAPAKEAQPLHHVGTPFETATFGMGCFWGCDSLFGATQGVLRTRVGYAGGNFKDPVYRNLGDQTEVIEIEYDPKTITYSQLLNLFWNNHEYGLTTPIKRQYMSLVLYHNEEQKRLAEESLKEEQEKRKPELIVTEVIPAGRFYAAEDYHQKYRLQGHKELAQKLGLNPQLLQTSHIASKLNGYLVGVGGVSQFLSDAESLGLTEKQIAYVETYCRKHEGSGLFC